MPSKVKRSSKKLNMSPKVVEKSSTEEQTPPEVEMSLETKTSSDVETISEGREATPKSTKKVPKIVLDQEQTEKACNALLDHISKLAKEAASKNDLLEDADIPVFLSVTFKNIPEKSRMKPVLVTLKHRIPGAHESMCLLVKEPADQWKKIVEDMDLKGTVKKVIGIQKLKTKYKSYEARRALCKSYDTFLADDRIPNLAEALGKAFYSKKKQPFQMTLSTKVLKGQINLIRSSTALHISTGVSSMVKIGTTSMTAEQLAENAVAASNTVAYRTDGGMKGIQSLFVKTATSVALPIYRSEVVFGEKFETFDEKQKKIKKAKKEKKEKKERKSTESEKTEEKKGKKQRTEKNLEKVQAEDEKAEGGNQKVGGAVKKMENSEEKVEEAAEKVEKVEEKMEREVEKVQKKSKKVKLQKESEKVEVHVQKAQKVQNKSGTVEKIEEKVTGDVQKVKKIGKMKEASEKAKGQNDKKRKR